ncbi:hypothetical protein J2Z40_002362 [Cytobacillus eiseniae]|uniref:MFS transporter n=1 Tax=Cytobacillus eiseniae TaxID=762947 RepID=A0ABS4RFV6_9BACI|nr:hypothetical protein [Cytobacillus eiseniae]MBP2241790.1 hypothetical protein [Cytobacillus eiseniae]
MAMQEFQQVVSTIATSDSSSEMGHASLIEKIQDPTLKYIIQSSVDQITIMAATDGYDGLFYSTVIIAIIIVLLSIILKPIRMKSLQKNDASDSIL